jgi:hypothetical protein
MQVKRNALCQAKRMGIPNTRFKERSSYPTILTNNAGLVFSPDGLKRGDLVQGYKLLCNSDVGTKLRARGMHLAIKSRLKTFSEDKKKLMVEYCLFLPSTYL